MECQAPSQRPCDMIDLLQVLPLRIFEDCKPVAMVWGWDNGMAPHCTSHWRWSNTENTLWRQKLTPQVFLLWHRVLRLVRPSSKKRRWRLWTFQVSLYVVLDKLFWDYDVNSASHPSFQESYRTPRGLSIGRLAHLYCVRRALLFVNVNDAFRDIPYCIWYFAAWVTGDWISPLNERSILHPTDSMRYVGYLFGLCTCSTG